jgi:glutathione S-transferase
MKLYYSPGACSLGIHVLLEEIGKPYEVELINVREGMQFQPYFTAVSPKSKVPALQRDDGSVLTEYGAIATWLARTNPDAHLLPADPDSEARAVEALDYLVATVHMQGFTRIARPGNFAPNEADKEAVQTRGREIYAKGLGIIDAALEGREWLAGAYSLADSALFYVCNWAPRAGIELPHNVAAHFARMKQRPAVQRALAAEGLSH